jgi:hypothetical protein
MSIKFAGLEVMLLKPKITITRRPVKTRNVIALLTPAPLFNPEIFNPVKIKISSIAVSLTPKS